MEESSPPPPPDRSRRAADPPDRSRPVKRTKDDHGRPRASRACDRCKARKTRCSGTWPCVFCANLKVDCQFTAINRRAPFPVIHIDSGMGSDERHDASTARRSSRAFISNNDDESLFDGASAPLTPPEAMVADEGVLGSPSATQTLVGVPSEGNTGHHRLGGKEATGENNPITNASSMRNSPEPSSQVTDQQGHYVGPASGVSFLSRVQRKLPIQSPGHLNSSIFNFGDRPLPGHDSSFVILPPKPLAESMLKRYFDFAATTHRFLHRPSMEAWLEELYETEGAMRHQETARSRKALLFMVFAHSNIYRNRVSTASNTWVEESGEASARYFAVAEHQLSMEKGEIRLATVQARLVQCFYLLTQSRLNHCWTLFGITSHLVLALGLHRKSRSTASRGNVVDHIEIECRKRTFWCAYNLNTYLSIALGRPMTFHDDDIDQDLPLCVDDVQFRLSPNPPSTTLGPSINTATIAQIRLSRVLSRILRALYGIRPPSTAKHFTLAAEFTQDLSSWRNHISYLLDTDGNSAIFVKLVLRQRDVLKLAFWHAQILVHRPFLLKTFTIAEDENHSSTSTSFLSSKKEEMRRNVKICIDAAMQITEHIDQIDAAGELYSTLFFIPYYSFSAVVVLYVYAIQQRAERPETYLAQFQAASRCHGQLESIATRGSLMQRYGVVLQELRVEVLRHNHHLAAVATPRPELTQSGPSPRPLPPTNNEPYARQRRTDFLDMSLPADRSMRGLDDQQGHDQDQVEPQVASIHSIDALDGGDLTQMSSWGLFDSLATGGMGTLDAMLPNGSTDLWESMGNTNFGSW